MKEPADSKAEKYDILYCALCGKNYNDVNKLITEDGVTVCDVCYEFCMESKKREAGIDTVGQ